MLVLFFLLWVIYNGSFTMEICIFGIAISLLLFAFSCKFMDHSWKREIQFYRMSFLFVQYIFLLVKEIVKANFGVFHMIVSQREEIQPKLVTFHSGLRTVMGKVFLANAITLTPGTITVELEGDQFMVHCLDESLAEGMDESVFVDHIKKMEEQTAGKDLNLAEER